MPKTVNFQKMKRELIHIYKEFLTKPSDKSIQKKALNYDRKFGGLSTYNNYFKSQLVPKEIDSALHWLSALYQFDTWEKWHELSNERIISNAEKILEGLRR